jgi:uncharacterized protein YjiS (DUF1127 family)
LYDEYPALTDYCDSCKSKEIKMLKQLFRSMVIARQASACRQSMQYLTDSQLNDIGFSRDNFVEGIQARISAELDVTEAQKTYAVPVNANLLGSV